MLDWPAFFVAYFSFRSPDGDSETDATANCAKIAGSIEPAPAFIAGEEVNRHDTLPLAAPD